MRRIPELPSSLDLLNTARVFRAARTAGIETTVLAPGKEGGLEALKLPPDAVCVLKEDLAAGYAVIVAMGSGGPLDAPAHP